MTTNKEITTVLTREKMFECECQFINLKYEYPGYSDAVCWAIITDLSYEKLREKYYEIIKSHQPFIILSVQQGEEIFAFRRNEEKHRKRAQLFNDYFSYDDEQTAGHHKELFAFDEQFDEREEKEKQEDEQIRILAILMAGVEELTDIQKRRVKAVYFEKKTLREVAKAEGVCYSKIEKSIQQTLKKNKKFFENRGYKTLPFSK